jgi:trehalose 6-phosphate phosphatase
LRDISRGKPLALFLDFDGTLVELAASPDAIEPRAGLGQALGKLAGRLEGRCAIVSGRAIADLENHVGALAVAVAGSHGSDVRNAAREPLGAGPAGLPDAAERALRKFATAEGLNFEEKPHGGALHYRTAPEKEEATRAFARDLAEEHGWAVQHGKCVVELVSHGANKGGAVTCFMSAPPFEGAVPVFVGDDLTDEAGFRVCRELGGTAILVGEERESQAEHRLPDVAAVHRWLELS